MHFVYTKKIAGIDYRVWITLLIVCLLSLSFITYRSIDRVVCQPFVVAAAANPDIQFKNTHYVNEIIHFTTSIPTTIRDTRIKWDFGDDGKPLFGHAANHAYTKPGNYIIKVSINNTCQEMINIHVIENISGGMSRPVADPIISTDIIMQGDSLLLTTPEQSSSYEWYVLERQDINRRNTQDVKILIPDPGIYTIVLRLDSGRIYQKKVQVQSLSISGSPGLDSLYEPGGVGGVGSRTEPPIIFEDDMNDPVQPDTTLPIDNPKPEPRQYDQLPEKAIQKMLEDVIEKKKDVADFNNILCEGGKTKVMANGNAIKFSTLVEDIKKRKGILKKKHKIESLTVARDEANGSCVKILYIKYK